MSGVVDISCCAVYRQGALKILRRFQTNWTTLKVSENAVVAKPPILLENLARKGPKYLSKITKWMPITKFETYGLCASIIKVQDV